MTDFEESEFFPIIEGDLPEPAPECRGCGVQCDLHNQLLGLLVTKHIISEAANSLVGEEGEAVDEMIEDYLPEEIAEHVKQGIRVKTSQDMDSIERDIAATRQEIHANTLSCSGVLKMRAAKDDVLYTVSVCTSARQHIRDGGERHMSVHVKADSLDA